MVCASEAYAKHSPSHTLSLLLITGLLPALHVYAMHGHIYIYVIYMCIYLGQNLSLSWPTEAPASTGPIYCSDNCFFFVFWRWNLNAQHSLLFTYESGLGCSATQLLGCPAAQLPEQSTLWLSQAPGKGGNAKMDVLRQCNPKIMQCSSFKVDYTNILRAGTKAHDGH